VALTAPRAQQAGKLTPARSFSDDTIFGTHRIQVGPERATVSPLSYNKIRFTAPVRAGLRVRMHLTILPVDEVPGGVQARSQQTFECGGSDRPALVAAGLGRIVG
jgi:acyl dehydratase